MYCGMCGTKMPDDENICPACGADMSLPSENEPPRPDEGKPGLLRRLIGKITGQ